MNRKQEKKMHQETLSFRPQKQRCLNSYRVPNLHNGHLEQNTPRNVTSLSILKNDFWAEEPKIC